MEQYTTEDIYSILEERVKTHPSELLITSLSNIKAELMFEADTREAQEHHMKVFKKRIELGYIGIDFKCVWDLFDGNGLIQLFLAEQIFSNISDETTLENYFSTFVDNEGLEVFKRVEVEKYYPYAELLSKRDMEFFYMRYIIKRIDILSRELEESGVEDVSPYCKFRLENDSVEIQFLDIYSFSSFNGDFDEKFLDTLTDFIEKMMAVEKSLKIN